MLTNLLTTLGHCVPIHQPELPLWQQILIYVLWGVSVLAAGGLFVRFARNRRHRAMKGDEHAK